MRRDSWKQPIATSQESPDGGAGSKLLLCAENLHKAFGGQLVLDGVSLDLRPGEVVLLRGDNGSGKTTLLNIITGNLEPDAGTITLFTNGAQVDLRFPRRWWQNLNPFDHFTPERVAREGVGRAWQEIRLFPTLSLQDNIALATPDQVGENPAWAILRRSTVAEQEKEILTVSGTMLAKLGLKGREISSADKVSLGQSKRVAIARAVQAGARILFLDEPLAGLDASGIADVMDLLEKLAHDEKVTLVIVEHVFHVSRILDLASTVWTLAAGKVTVETPARVRAELEHATRDGIRGWMKEVAGPHGKIVDQLLPGGAVISTVMTVDGGPSKVVLEVEDLVVHRGRRLVVGDQGEDGHVRGLALALSRGQLAILQAPNGWGKTTLLEALAGLIPATRGTIRLNGQPIQHLPPWERSRLGLAMLQARNHIFPGLTVLEALRLARVRDVPQTVRHLLGRRMSDLSGGEKQRVAVACALNTFTIALLDEPFSALDPDAVTHLYSSLRQRPPDAALLVAVPGRLENREREVTKGAMR